MKLANKLVAVLLLYGTFVSANQGAESKSGSKSAKHQHREHSAHKHGSGQISIAIEGLNGEIDFEAPGDSIYGFEYEAKKPADKKKQEEALSFLQKNISEIVRFEQKLNCIITKIKTEIEQHKSDKHSHVEAKFKITCEKSPLGSTLIFNVQTTFPKLKNVAVTVIVDDIQKSAEANKNGVKLELKN